MSRPQHTLLTQLAERAARGPGPADGAARPPCGDFDIRIAADGTWHYRGSPIRRARLCKLFATVLRREDDGSYWLVTPAERGRIAVDDAPFVAVEMRAETGADGGPALHFRTNLDEWTRADADHPISVLTDPESGEPRPYIRVRDRLDALIARPVFYDLVALGEERDGRLTVASAGVRFDLGALEEGGAC